MAAGAGRRTGQAQRGAARHGRTIRLTANSTLNYHATTTIRTLKSLSELIHGRLLRGRCGA
jgi:hypothetical protein